MEVLQNYFEGYNLAFISSCPPAKKGYAGTMVLYKKELQAKTITPRIGAPDTMDDEGSLSMYSSGKPGLTNATRGRVSTNAAMHPMKAAINAIVRAVLPFLI